MRHTFIAINIFQNENNNEAELFLDTETHWLKLKAFGEQCGPLCDFQKPVLDGPTVGSCGDAEKFMGRVTAKVTMASF